MRDLSGAVAPLSLSTNPVLRRPGVTIQHEETITLRGHAIRVVVLMRANRMTAHWRCSTCSGSGYSPVRDSIETALEAAFAGAGRHVVDFHSEPITAGKGQPCSSSRAG